MERSATRKHSYTNTHTHNIIHCCVQNEKPLIPSFNVFMCAYLVNENCAKIKTTLNKIVSVYEGWRQQQNIKLIHVVHLSCARVESSVASNSYFIVHTHRNKNVDKARI